jgi:hydroxyquinol 1,2-dioxygenase
MRNLTEQNVTEVVLDTFVDAQNPRLKEIMTSLVKHIHAFVREVDLTEEEWMYGIEFLTRTGHMCDDKRQEFILLSDTLGVTTLKDIINNRKPPGVTEYTIFGPFYVDGAPEMPSMASIAGDTPGEPVIVSGRVISPEGQPLAGALLDVWQASADGFYDVQLPHLTEMNLRGKFRADAQGRYAFRSIKPSCYPVPGDGPVGQMIKAAGRHPYRPAHIHFIVSAEGYEPITTELFAEGDPYLDSDVVFGVRNSLVVDFVRHESAEEAERYGVTTPFYTVAYDFILQPVTG